jgi:hypothetical protein
MVAIPICCQDSPSLWAAHGATCPGGSQHQRDGTARTLFACPGANQDQVHENPGRPGRDTSPCLVPDRGGALHRSGVLGVVHAEPAVVAAPMSCGPSVPGRENWPVLPACSPCGSREEAAGGRIRLRVWPERV